MLTKIALDLNQAYSSRRILILSVLIFIALC